jgi:hypothetical protein
MVGAWPIAGSRVLVSPMRSMRQVPSGVMLAMLAILLVEGCSGSDEPKPGSSPTASADLDPSAALRRPWAQATIPAGGTCPVTAAVTRPDPDLGSLLGDGPARPAGLGADAVLRYFSPAEQSDWMDQSWGGQKVLWAVDPGYSGPVLVRGRRLDAPGELAFEDPAQPELLLNTEPYEGRPGGWKDIPSFTRLRAPGCYAYQIDTDRGTWSIIFTARGPRF